MYRNPQTGFMSLSETIVALHSYPSWRDRMGKVPMDFLDPLPPWVVLGRVWTYGARKYGCNLNTSPGLDQEAVAAVEALLEFMQNGNLAKTTEAPEERHRTPSPIRA